MIIILFYSEFQELSEWHQLRFGAELLDYQLKDLIHLPLSILKLKL